MVDGQPARMALLLVDSQNGSRYDHQIEPIDVIMVYWCNGVVEVNSTIIRDGQLLMRLSASEEEEKEEVDDVGEEGCGTRGDDGLACVDYRSSDTTINL
jgi:hypothetical protein